MLQSVSPYLSLYTSIKVKLYFNVYRPMEKYIEYVNPFPQTTTKIYTYLLLLS